MTLIYVKTNEVTEVTFAHKTERCIHFKLLRQHLMCTRFQVYGNLNSVSHSHLQIKCKCNKMQVLRKDSVDQLTLKSYFSESIFLNHYNCANCDLEREKKIKKKQMLHVVSFDWKSNFHPKAVTF